MDVTTMGDYDYPQDALCARCGQHADPWRGICDDCAIEIENGGASLNDEADDDDLDATDVPWR